MQEKIGQVIMDTGWYDGYDTRHEEPCQDELMNLAMTCSQDELNRVIAEKKSFPVLYHFSHVRENAVSWLPMKGDERVLELGAACGALTGKLCEMAGHVVSVDASKKRGLVNAYRHQTCDNLEIRIGDFKDMEEQLECFDLITLIGVFEDAADYVDAKEPFSALLSLLKKHLNPGGRILVAMDNPLGMKYFAGNADEHTGQYFDSIRGNGVKTLSKTEWQELMAKTGMKGEFYYPYPDFRFPMAIYSDEWLPAVGELDNAKGNFAYPRVGLFDEGKAFDEIIKNGLFTQFANAYIILLESED